MIHSPFDLTGPEGELPQLMGSADSASLPTSPSASNEENLPTTRGYLRHLQAQSEQSSRVHASDVRTLLLALRREGLGADRLSDRPTREAVREIATAIATDIIPQLSPADQTNVSEHMAGLSRSAHWGQLMVHLGIGADLIGPNQFLIESGTDDAYHSLREALQSIHTGAWVVILDQIRSLVMNHEELLPRLALDGSRPAVEFIRDLLRVAGDGHADAFALIDQALSESGSDDF